LRVGRNRGPPFTSQTVSQNPRRHHYRILRSLNIIDDLFPVRSRALPPGRFFCTPTTPTSDVAAAIGLLRVMTVPSADAPESPASFAPVNGAVYNLMRWCTSTSPVPRYRATSRTAILRLLRCRPCQALLPHAPRFQSVHRWPVVFNRVRAIQRSDAWLSPTKDDFFRSPPPMS